MGLDKLKALKAHSDKFQCDHPSKEIRHRVVKGGASQYVEQCLTCGKAISQPYPKTKAIQMNGGKQPIPFDTELMDRWQTEYSNGFKRIEQEFSAKGEIDDAEFKKWYGEYLASPEWKQIAKRVMDRANGICEGCLERTATEVHHLTYRDVGAEFCFQLVALCRECHDRYHRTDEAKEQ